MSWHVQKNKKLIIIKYEACHVKNQCCRFTSDSYEAPTLETPLDIHIWFILT